MVSPCLAFLKAGQTFLSIALPAVGDTPLTNLRAQVYSMLHTPADISFSRCPLKQTSWEHTDIIRRWMGSQRNLSGSISIPKNFRHVSLFEAPSAVNQPACVVNISPNAWNETAVGYLFTNAITVLTRIVDMFDPEWWPSNGMKASCWYLSSHS
jgi:hypothetical protein